MDFLADYLFRTDAGLVTQEVSERYPDALLTGQFITLNDPGVMFVAYAGKQTDALKALVDAGFAKVQKPLSAAEFAAAFDSFRYHLLSDLQTPMELADNFGWYTVEGAPDYAPGANGDRGTYFAAASSLTPEFVAAVAQKYLAKPPVVVTLRPPSAAGKPDAPQ
jgi:predicted Zn-dependent peptidase